MPKTTPAVSYTYDGNNQLGYRTAMSDGSGSTAWTYDARGRVTQETKVILGQSFTTGWSYNSADLPVSMTYPDSEVVNTTYDNRMQPTSLAGTDTYLQNVAYDSAGRTREQIYGLGVFTKQYTYNAWNVNGGRLSSMIAGTLQNLTYGYDSVGNITSITDSLSGPQVQSFTYDTLDRLTSAEAVGGLDGLYTETYGYDTSTGNLASKAGNAYTYGDTSHAHAVTSLSNGNMYTYDANGNQTSRVVGTDSYTHIYDAENRLIQVVKNGNTLAEFIYDGDGSRVASTINGTTTRFVGEYYEVTPTETTKHYSTGVQKVALRKNGTLTYILGDHLGGTSTIVDTLGQKIAENWYLPFGVVRYTSGTLPTNYTFTGQYSNTADFGWIYYKARWYDPTLGRFAQADSIVPGTGDPRAWDRYGYVYSNPVNLNDPSGNTPWYILGWKESYLFRQQGNTCAVASTAVAISILMGHAYTQADIQGFWPLTYDRYVDLPIDKTGQFNWPWNAEKWQSTNIAIGVVPSWQVSGINEMFPGQIEASYSQGKRSDLMSNLNNGSPTMITLAFHNNSIGHVIVVIGYDPATGGLLFYNPAYGDIETESQILSLYNDGRGFTSFDELWAASNSFISSNSMVTVWKTSPMSIISARGSGGGGVGRKALFN